MLSKNTYNMKIGTSIIFLLISSVLFSQTNPIKYCGSVEAEEKFKKENPHLVNQIESEQEKLELSYQKYNQANYGVKAGQVYTIPVVFHIIHTNGPENISDAQIKDAVKILNEDFRKLNPGNANVVAAFQGISADCEIEFRLAQKDPNGNCTNGIDRIYSTKTDNADDNSKLNGWPRSKYLNIWVVRSIGSGAAGYAYLPASAQFNSAGDGIIILSTYVGSIGTGNNTLSHALTHEVGHYINLYHPWGSSNNPGVSTNCNDDDQVTDTPNTVGWTSCNLNGTSCGSLDNVQNFMEYSYCSNMFTEGQKTRMRNALNSSTAQRNSLWTTSNLAATGTDGVNILCKAEFQADFTSICAGQQVKYTDGSYNGVTTWSWAFQGGTPASSIQQNPTVTYNSTGKYDVSLSAGNGTSSVSQTKSLFIDVIASPGKPVPIVEGFESAAIPGTDWIINNPDNSSSYKWQLATNASFSGTKSAKMNNFGNAAGNKDDLISTTYDLSGLSSANLTFKMAYAQRSSSNSEKLKVYVSTNCGQTWALRYAKAGSSLATVGVQTSAYTPSSQADWREESVSLSSTFMVKDLRVKFEFESDNGNNLYLDDINLSAPTGITEINQPVIGLSVAPNPVKHTSVMQFSLLKDETISVEVYDILGQLYKTLHNGQLSSGDYRYVINSSDFSSGLYFIRIASGNNVSTQKLIIQ
jgi:PKD repeat protein